MSKQIILVGFEGCGVQLIGFVVMGFLCNTTKCSVGPYCSSRKFYSNLFKEAGHASDMWWDILRLNMITEVYNKKYYEKYNKKCIFAWAIYIHRWTNIKIILYCEKENYLESFENQGLTGSIFREHVKCANNASEVFFFKTRVTKGLVMLFLGRWVKI